MLLTIIHDTIVFINIYIYIYKNNNIPTLSSEMLLAIDLTDVNNITFDRNAVKYSTFDSFLHLSSSPLYNGKFIYDIFTNNF